MKGVVELNRKDTAEIVHTLTSPPGYSPRLDRVTMPHLSQFENADEYYCTLYHELTHNADTRIMPRGSPFPPETRMSCCELAA